MSALERFLRYVTVHTASAEDAAGTPSTARQFDLSRMLERELKELGVEEVFVDEHAYVYGALPPTPGCENRPAVAFVAHLDTVPDFSGENVRPQILENYDGGPVALGGSGRVLSPADFPHLPQLKGQTLITTDGTTVLGADDKAGIAAIMHACETLQRERRPHGRVAVCFTPDEEIGHGADLMQLERVKADFAYTVDGGELDCINYETFNAASAKWTLHGFNIHPGSAKNKMINACLTAMEVNAMLPAGDTPAHTEGHEGFFHLTEMSGDVAEARLHYIIRDHDEAAFRLRIKTMEHAAALINEKYGAGTAELTITEQYRNMLEKVLERPEVVSLAERAIRRAGFEPKAEPIRGGTDGSHLSFRGLVCPNLGTGGYACHGPYEHATAEGLEKAAEIVLNIVDEIARME
ncbi:MAG: peptidase T [Oscillospiraceae bacterium]|nr:peptidase T [Oscillospiraceae bacterium]